MERQRTATISTAGKCANSTSIADDIVIYLFIFYKIKKNYWKKKKITNTKQPKGALHKENSPMQLNKKTICPLKTHTC